MKTTSKPIYVLCIISVLVLCLSVAEPGMAQVPKKIHYQGYLTDSSGLPVNGTRTMTFAIYDVPTSGTALWSETQNVEVKDGRYSLYLGQLNPFTFINPTTLPGPKPYYLGLTISPDPEMTPREELASVMYALFVEGLIVEPHNTLVGLGAGAQNAGLRNTFIGRDAGQSNTTGHSNTFIGNEAGSQNTNGELNTFIGAQAGYANDVGGCNTFVGNEAGYNNAGTNSFHNTFIGHQAGFANKGGYHNTFVGAFAGINNLTGRDNIFIGKATGYENTEGNSNTFVGSWAGQQNTTGEENTFLGHSSGENAIIGDSNTFVGGRAGYYHEAGGENTFIGYGAGSDNIIGSRNVFLGYLAGRFEVGSNKLYIANSDTNTPLIYGEFDNHKVVVNGKLHVSEMMRLVPQSSVPPNPLEGDMYMDANDHKLKVFDGTIWRACW